MECRPKISPKFWKRAFRVRVGDLQVQTSWRAENILRDKWNVLHLTVWKKSDSFHGLFQIINQMNSHVKLDMIFIGRIFRFCTDRFHSIWVSHSGSFHLLPFPRVMLFEYLVVFFFIFFFIMFVANVVIPIPLQERDNDTLVLFVCVKSWCLLFRLLSFRNTNKQIEENLMKTFSYVYRCCITLGGTWWWRKLMFSLLHRTAPGCQFSPVNTGLKEPCRLFNFNMYGCGFSCLNEWWSSIFV